MHTPPKETIERIKEEIAKQLSYAFDDLPALVEDKQAAKVLGVKQNTLAVWRSTGRYRLPFVKVGRMVRYRVSDLAEFMARRTVGHTGEIA